MPLLDLNEPVHRRRLLFGFLALIAVVILWFLWQTVSGGGVAGAEWSYSQLVHEAGKASPKASPDIKRLDINGQNGVVTDLEGRQHPIHLPPDSTAVANQLAGDGVDVYYHGDSSSAPWLPILLVLAVLAALGGV